MYFFVPKNKYSSFKICILHNYCLRDMVFYSYFLEEGAKIMNKNITMCKFNIDVCTIVLLYFYFTDPCTFLYVVQQVPRIMPVFKALQPTGHKYQIHSG